MKTRTLLAVTGVLIGIAVATPPDQWAQWFPGLFVTRLVEASPPVRGEAWEPPPRALPSTPSFSDDGDSDIEMIGGYPFKKSANCRLHHHVTEKGEVSSGILCDPQPRTPHRYATLSIDELRDMAYRDPDAAEILAVKLGEDGDIEAGFEYAARAVALRGGNTTRALSRFHNSFFTSTEGRNANDDIEIDVESVSNRYVLHRIADILKGTNVANYARQTLLRAGLSPQDFQRLEARIASTLAYMSDVEIEVVGSNTIQEQLGG